MTGSIKWVLFSLIFLGGDFILYAIACVMLYVKHHYYLNDLIASITCFLVGALLILGTIQEWRNLNKDISRKHIYDNSDMD